MGTRLRLALLLSVTILGHRGPPADVPGDDPPDVVVHSARCPECKKKCEWQGDCYYCSVDDLEFSLDESSKNTPLDESAESGTS
jgi:hypothetical protein